MRHCAARSLTTSCATPTLSSYFAEGFVRLTARLCLVVLLVTSLPNIPAFAGAASGAKAPFVAVLDGGALQSWHCQDLRMN